MPPPPRRTDPRQILWRVLGVVLVAIGIVNAFLPLLPTTVFLIAGAWALGKGAPEWKQRLLDHPRYGPALRRWEDGGRVSRRGKRIAVAGIAASFAFTLLLAGPTTPTLVVGVILAAVATWLWRRPE